MKTIYWIILAVVVVLCLTAICIVSLAMGDTEFAKDVLKASAVMTMLGFVFLLPKFLDF
jgi:flagellar basal body-associated protein FliL